MNTESTFKAMLTLFMAIALAIAPFSFNELKAEDLGDPAVLFADLRGEECFAQPDMLTVCGAPDTIPIMLFTKSVDPIYDVELRVDLEDGITFRGFAYVQSGNAILDTINVENTSSPVFRISEISQEGLGVVIYLGVVADCDFSASSPAPKISYTVSYVSAGVPCVDVYSPNTPYAQNVSEPMLAFTGTPSPATRNLTQLGTDECVTIQVTNTSATAGATEALVEFGGYGYTEGVTVTNITVDGNTLPYTVDPLSGKVSLEISSITDPTIWGGDNVLGFNEIVDLVVCFQTQGCTDVDTDPTYTIRSLCLGEICTDRVDETTHRIRTLYSFGQDLTLEYEFIQESEFCGPGGVNTPYVYEVTMYNGNTTPIEGDLWNLIYRADTCTANYLQLDTVYVIDAAGAILGGVPISLQRPSGKLEVDFRSLPAGLDIDGSGGLVDLDGDGVLDDLEAGDSLRLRIEYQPACDPSAAACSAEAGVCDFLNHDFYAQYNCGRSGRRITEPMDDGVPPISNESEGSFVDTTSFYYPANSPQYMGYDWGTFGGTTGAVSTVGIEFDYNLDPADFYQCTGDYIFSFSFTSRSIEEENMEFSNIMFDGTSYPNFTTDEVIPGVRRVTLNVGSTVPMSSSITFDASLDSVICAPPIVGTLNGFLFQDCDGCDCTLSRACSAVRTYSDPQNDASCVSNRSITSIRRISTGYTDRTLSTKLDTASIPDADKKRAIPGDTIQVKSTYIVEAASDLNLADAYIIFTLRYVELGSISVINRRVLPDMADFRLQNLEFRRAGMSPIDIGALDIPGNPNLNEKYWNGGSIGISTSAPTIIHPGITGNAWEFNGTSRNSSNDYYDGNFVTVHLGNSFDPSGQQGITALKSLIGSEFMNNDTIIIEYSVPVMCAPEFLFSDPANPTFPGATPDSLIGEFEAALSPAQYIGTDGSVTGLSGTSPAINGLIEFIKPSADYRSELNLTNDCQAELVNTLKIIDQGDDLDWFADEFRPMLGYEDFIIEVPAPFYFKLDSVTMTHTNLPAMTIAPDSTEGFKEVIYNGDTYLTPTGASGFLYFTDIEKENGLRAPGYLDESDNDVSLVGGTFPLLGVGLMSDGTTEDSLVVRIPLNRICSDALMGEPITSTINVSNQYLADYGYRNRYTCNDGRCPLGDGNYWPYDREDNFNPHHIFNDLASNATVQNGPLATYAATTSNDAPGGLIMDGPGNETVTFTINTADTPDGGYLSISVDNAIEVISILGNPPVLAATNDSTNIYMIDLAVAFGSPLPTTDMDVPIVTNLTFCEQATICVKASLGCSDDMPTGYDLAEAVAVLAGADMDCASNPVSCYEYVSGLPEVEFSYNFNTVGLCETAADQTITITNTGQTDLNDVNLVAYLPANYTASNWEYSITGGVTGVAIADPTEDPSLTGVNGVAYTWPASTFPVLPEGESMIITFDGETSCETVIGSKTFFEFTATGACEIDYASGIIDGPVISVFGLEPNGPMFSIDNDNVEVNCIGQTMVIVTAINTGKSASGESTLCLDLPPNIDFDEADIEWIAPAGFSTMNFSKMPVGTGGAQKIELTAPVTEMGGFFCVKIMVDTDLPCGEEQIGFNVKKTEEITCAGSGPCDVSVMTGEQQFLTLEVVPGANAELLETTAGCTANPDELEINYTFVVRNDDDAPYSDNVALELFHDIDINAMIDAYDISIGTMTHPVAIPPNDEVEITGSFIVPSEYACALVFDLEVPGCACSEIVIPVDDIIPAFVAELGENLLICGPAPYVIEDICGDVTYEIDPAAAGTITEVGDDLEVVLNPGFGEDSPVIISFTSKVGNCIEQSVDLEVRKVDDLEGFGPFNFSACDTGCTAVDLGIDPALAEDLDVMITPSDFLEDPTSINPVICNPTSTTLYEITFTTKDGSCSSTANMLIDVVESPKVTLMSVTGCTDGVDLTGVATITPTGLDGTWSSDGDGTFEGGARYSTATKYIPGPLDKASGSVLLTLKSDRASDVCGSGIARSQFEILLVDCGSGKWDGN